MSRGMGGPVAQSGVSYHSAPGVGKIIATACMIALDAAIKDILGLLDDP
jgi:hypothetical protein